MKLVEYLDGFQYTGEELNFFPHAEGYVNVTLGTTGSRIFNYVYNYTDHLGNIRLSYTKDMVNNQLKILEENNYYPFGLKHQKYSSAGSIGLKAIDEVTARPANLTSTPYNYKYNGFEYQDELGLAWYDYIARNYDPTIGRWFNIDPLAEMSRKTSPYVYALNNPVYFIDPDGMMAEGFGTDDVIITGEFKQEAFSQLQQGTDLNLKMDDNGKLSATGEAKTDSDKVLAAAINNENVTVNINTTSSNYDQNGNWIVGGAYGGSEIIVGGANDGKVVADQTVNPDMTKEVDNFYEMGEGTMMLHEVMEAYIGAVKSPGVKGMTATDGNPLGYQEAHDAAKGLDSRYKEANIIKDPTGVYMSKYPYDSNIPPSLNPEKLINNLKK